MSQLVQGLMTLLKALRSKYVFFTLIAYVLLVKILQNDLDYKGKRSHRDLRKFIPTIWLFSR